MNGEKSFERISIGANIQVLIEVRVLLYTIFTLKLVSVEQSATGTLSSVLIDK